MPTPGANLSSMAHPVEQGASIADARVVLVQRRPPTRATIA